MLPKLYILVIDVIKTHDKSSGLIKLNKFSKTFKKRNQSFTLSIRLKNTVFKFSKALLKKIKALHYRSNARPRTSLPSYTKTANSGDEKIDFENFEDFEAFEDFNDEKDKVSTK